MRIIGIMAISVWLSVCTSTPMFPPETMKDVEANSVDIKAWGKGPIIRPVQSWSLTKWNWSVRSSELFESQRVLSLVAEEQPIEANPMSNQTTVEQDGPFWLAIMFKGSVEPRMLQTGNRLIAWGRRGEPEQKCSAELPECCHT